MAGEATDGGDRRLVDVSQLASSVADAVMTLVAEGGRVDAAAGPREFSRERLGDVTKRRRR